MGMCVEIHASNPFLLSFRDDYTRKKGRLQAGQIRKQLINFDGTADGNFLRFFRKGEFQNTVNISS